MVLTGWGAAGVQTRQRQEQLPHFFQRLTLTQNHSDRLSRCGPDSRDALWLLATQNRLWSSSKGTKVILKIGPASCHQPSTPLSSCLG